VSAIHLTWDDPDAGNVTFEIERTKEGESVAEILSSPTPFDDTGLEEATTYSYVVTTFRIKDNEPSGPSDQASGRTFGVAFEADLTSDQTGLEGFCLVQRIEPTRLRQSTLPGDIGTLGARVRITVRGSTAASLTLDRIYISQPAAAGDPYDSAADLMPVASGVVVPANTAVPLPVVDYDLDRTRPLLVAFDISSNAGLGNVRFVTGVPATEATTYFRGATTQASIDDRSPSAADPGSPAYSSTPTIYLIEKIEVL
jgi:hypothetical protein